MIKRVWTVIAVMAIANLLAIGGLGLWLNATDRLSQDRLRAVKMAFAKTIAEEQVLKAEVEAKDKAEKQKQEQEAKAAKPPVTAAEKLAQEQFKDDQRQQLLQRQQQELDTLRVGLMKELADLKDREKAFEERKIAYDNERKRMLELEGDKQFKLALSTLEGQKPKDAKQMLKALIDQKQTDQVTSYLNKLEEGKRAKIIAEFAKDDAPLAADLLERLRTKGTGTGTGTGTGAGGSGAIAQSRGGNESQRGNSPVDTRAGAP